MLARWGTFLGVLQSNVYYVLDGKVWVVRAVSGRIERSDDWDETQEIIRKCKENQP
jgi:hypothetical protein